MAAVTPRSHARRRARRTGLREEPAASGAAHYLIHAYDDPVHAPSACVTRRPTRRSRRRRARAAHAVAHLRRDGHVDESATINERSVKAADARRDAKKLDVDRRGFHVLLWLVYCTPNRAATTRRAASSRRWKRRRRRRARSGTRSHLALARAAWLIETRKWARQDAGGLERPAERRGDRRALRDRFCRRAIGNRPVRRTPCSRWRP